MKLFSKRTLAAEPPNQTNRIRQSPHRLRVRSLVAAATTAATIIHSQVPSPSNDTFNPDANQHVLAPAAQAVGQSMSITTANKSDGANVTSVTLNRAEAGPITYQQSDLIPVGDVTVFNGALEGALFVAPGVAAPARGLRATLIDGDFSVNTGLANLTKTASEGIVVTFASPVENSLGPDVIFFEPDNSPELTGDGLYVTVGSISRSYGSADYIALSDLSLQLNLYSARSGAINSLEQLEQDDFDYCCSATYRLFGVAIDLDDFNVPSGHAVNEMRFRTAETESSNGVDPAFVAGLPRFPPPIT